MKEQPCVRRELRISAANVDAAFVQITVSDSGAGMNSEQLEALFQARATTKEHGLGLGLILLRSVVSNHGGKRSEEHTSELQSLMRISYAVFCLRKKTQHIWNKLYDDLNTSLLYINQLTHTS